VNPLLLAGAAALTSGVGALGGLGGAILLVPLLVVAGVPASEAAPLGLLSVVAGSSAAAHRQMREHTTNFRIGVVTETAATVGAIAGALAAGAVSEAALTWALAAVAVIAAVAGAARKGTRWSPDPAAGDEDVGEWVGTLRGAYRLPGGVVPYVPRRVVLGTAAIGLSGLITGVSGVGGGFVKTPAKSEIMHVPVKVSSSTTTFSIGVTAAAALLVMIVDGRLDFGDGALVVLGSLAGGLVGSAVQSRLSPPVVRRTLSVLLVVVAGVLVRKVL